jgi:hypothetical protein
MSTHDSLFMSLGYGQRPTWQVRQKDFGFGCYYTPKLRVTKMYASSSSVILVHDWSEEGGMLATKSFESEEWKVFVKANNCFGTNLVHAPPQPVSEDFLIGRLPPIMVQLPPARLQKPIERYKLWQGRMLQMTSWPSRLLVVLFFE